MAWVKQFSTSLYPNTFNRRCRAAFADVHTYHWYLHSCCAGMHSLSAVATKWGLTEHVKLLQELDRQLQGQQLDASKV